MHTHTHSRTYTCTHTQTYAHAHEHTHTHSLQCFFCPSTILKYIPAYIHHPQNVSVSSGSSEEDYLKMKQILQNIPDIKYICLDVANGYSEHFVSFVRKARQDFPSHTILVRAHDHDLDEDLLHTSFTVTCYSHTHTHTHTYTHTHTHTNTCTYTHTHRLAMW